jgi:hypothetical protein
MGFAREREAALATTIVEYWLERGFRIHAHVVPIVLKATIPPLWVVRSDLLNGLPRHVTPKEERSD